METQDSTRDKDFWTDLRHTVRQGVREIRDMGDEFARQSRLRMDVFQTERRLKATHEALGEAVFPLLNDNRPVSADDARIQELVSRIHYYTQELERLRRELTKPREAAS